MRNLFESEKTAALIKALRSGFNGYAFYMLETFAAIAFVAFRAEVAGAAFFVALIGVILLVCDDILPTTLPFLIVSAITTNCYDSFNLFFPFIIYAPIVVACLVFHFVVYPKPVQTGESARGIFAVSLAVMFGGIGRYTLADYFYGAYYILGLGFGMLAAYFAMKSQFSVRRDYDLKEKFSAIMTLLGVLCAFMIAYGYLKYNLKWVTSLYPGGFSRNNLSTLLMFAMPFPLYLSHKRKFAAILTLVFYAAIAASTSRGGLLCGGAELAFCCVYWILCGENRKKRTIICIAALLFFAAFTGKFVYDWLMHRIEDQNATIENDARWRMMWEAVNNFLKRPISGNGILDKEIYYAAFKKKGSMSWYHMMIPQVVGSMGLIGVAAYSFQSIGRLRLALKRACKWSLCLGISYLGILFMSQVNPGEFCPLPFELLTVILFILQEERLAMPKPLYGLTREARQ